MNSEDQPHTQNKNKQHENYSSINHNHHHHHHNTTTMNGGNDDYSDSHASDDLEDGGAVLGNENNNGSDGENPGLMRTTRRTRGSYESVLTNNNPQQSNNNSSSSFVGRMILGNSCCSFLCQTIVIVTALMLIGTTGFLIGSAKPDLLIATPPNNSIMCDEQTITMINETEITDIIDTEIKKKKKSITVRYDPNTVLANSNTDDDDNDVSNNNNNPFNIPPGGTGNNLFLTPPQFNSDDSSAMIGAGVGFLTHPHLVDNRLVFLSEGDVYVTQLSSNSDPNSDSNTNTFDSMISASKVTTTIGNIIDPKWHPTLPLIAYTATYSGRRDVYLMDLSSGNEMKKKSLQVPIRLTYWDVGAGGVSGIIGWISTNNDGNYNALVFRALSNDSSLPDNRLYIIHLSTLVPSSETTKATGSNSANANNSPSVLEIEPIPLAQAIDATRYNKCWYFVRINQSSHTIRYVGGTAENLWKYCDHNDNSDDDGDDSDSNSSLSLSSQRLFTDDGYKGTSKSPQLYHHKIGEDHHHYLFFLSDRGRNTVEPHPVWVPDRMNVWALRLNDNIELYSTNDLIQITDTSCDFEGRTIREYTVDSITGNLVVRIGADLYFMSNNDIQSKIEEYNDSNSAENNNRRQRSLEQQDGSTGDDNDEKGEKDETNTTTMTTGALKDKVVVKEKSDNNKTKSAVAMEDDTNNTSSSVTTTTTTKKDLSPVAKNTENALAGTTTTSSTLTSSNTADTSDTANEDDTGTVSKEKATEEEDNDKLPETVPAIVPDTTEEDNVATKNTTIDATTPVDQNDDGSPTTTTTTVTVESLEIDDDLGINITSFDNIDNSTEPPAKYYYDFESPDLVSRSAVNAADDLNVDHYSGHSTELKRLPIVVYSDFQNVQERIVPVDIIDHFKYGDVFETITGSVQMLMTLRGQLWVAPVVDDEIPSYKDSGKNMPARRYRIAPGAMMGGVTRILASMHVPNPVEDDTSDRRLAVILATDPLTSTAEHAFYLVETQPGVSPLFVDMKRLPKPFLGGFVSGGSTKDGGLGSIKPDTLAMSPCGNRMAWSDTDGRIVVMNLPQYQELDGGESSSSLKQSVKFVVLPKNNELDESMVGDEVDLVFSPGGRYLSIQHNARNQFQIISIADLGDPLGEENKIADIVLGRIVQATPSRFNSVSAYWGKTPTDIHNFVQNKTMSKLFSVDEPDDVATTLYYLSDRDIMTDVSNPWGSRQRMPHFVNTYGVYALPFQAKDMEASDSHYGQFRGGGVEELHVETLLERMDLIQALLDKKTASAVERRERRKLAETLNPLAGAFGFAEKAFENQKRRSTTIHRQLDEDRKDENKDDEDDEMINTDDHLEEAEFPIDMDIDFGPVDLTFARKAYRLSTIPEGAYNDILCQNPDGSLLLTKDGTHVEVFQAEGYPSDQYESKSFQATSRRLADYGLSASRKFIYLVYSPDGAIRVVPNTVAGTASLLADNELDENVVDKKGMHLSIWPSLEYRQMYDDAWRMLRDYFYDPDMTGIDWSAIHERFLPLVERCTKREEIDDVLIQMASELSALHVFVYGGEYNSPTHGDDDLEYVNEVGSLGAILKRTPAWKGYTVMNIPEADPDFTKIDHSVTIYSPLSDQSLRLSGQRGLQVGDVIVGVNGESVMSVPDIHMLLRGTSGRSIRLDVLRLTSGTAATTDDDGTEALVESLITVPISPSANADLLYSAWEYKTEQKAEELAAKAGISVGYVHMRDMSGAQAEDAFARGFFPNYKKQGFILDVRHNRGGNIDSWVLDVLQRKPWMYWQSRDFDATNGGLDWDMHFAFRGHVIVLLDEKTSSDGEGVSRGIKELGLGKLIGTRTWGGGIWLSSDNHLVDGGIATAPEIGTFNEHINWGLGVEQMGVDPDIVVDNDPHEAYTGKDRQLERAIVELKKWIEDEPVVIPKPKGKRKDMTMGDRECKASSPEQSK